MVNLTTKPPAVLTDMAIVAANNKIGLWSLDAVIDMHNRKVSTSNSRGISSFIKRTDIAPYILIESDKTARPIACAFMHDYDEIALTKHVALNKGYTLVDTCAQQ
jgi:hypothetical protein